MALDVEYIRLINFAIIALTSAGLFVFFNDTWQRDPVYLKFIRFGSVGFFAVAAEGSLEAYLRHSPMTAASFGLLFFTLVVDLGLLHGWLYRKKYPERRREDWSRAEDRRAARSDQ